MKSLGLIGGTSWHSTIDYYRYINEMVNEQKGSKTNPPLVIYNLNQQEIHNLQQEDHWEKIVQINIEAGKKLEKAGAEGLIFCANTQHKTYKQVQPHFEIPILHIADATAKSAKERGLKKLGLIGTKFTMEGDFVKGRIQEEYGIEVITPEKESREKLHNLILDELCHGKFTNEAREYVKTELNKLNEKGAEGMILGCTEFPILVKQEHYELPLYDTTYLHAQYAVDFILSN